MNLAYTVRLPDQTEVALTADRVQFEQNLRSVFPECDTAAINFYRELDILGDDLRRLFRRVPDFLERQPSRQSLHLLREGKAGARIKRAKNENVASHLGNVSDRFRRFIDVQLQTFAGCAADEASYLYAALALTERRGNTFTIAGGGSGLANKLSESIKLSGGKVRLDTPVLRLAYDSSGQPVGVDLLSGETVHASKAIISNLTIWDTYGKLVGLNRTPNELRAALKTLRSPGAYLIYVGLEESTAQSLRANNQLLITGSWSDSFQPEDHQLNFSVAPAWDPRAPQGKRAATVHAFTDVDDWFTFHQDESEEENKDQEMLERCWERLHAAMPELGSGAEVIDTATPRTFYEATRRKLGMVGGVPVTPEAFWRSEPSYVTPFSNLFIVSDTVSPGGIAELTQAALLLANHLSR